MEANVILAKCEKTGKTFGIRVEKRDNYWVRTWAFPISDKAAKHEGFDDVEISGNFISASGYPGCPHCEARRVIICGCGKLSCYNGAETSTCRWCGDVGGVTRGGVGSVKVRAGGL
jgi:hypothetical protein